MMSSNSFNSSYQFAETLCYTSSMPPSARSLSTSYPSQVRPMSFSSPKRGYRRSYAWTSSSDPDMKESKRQSSSFVNNSYSNLSYIDYDSDTDSDDSYDSDSNSTFNNYNAPSPSVLSEATAYSSTICSSIDNSMRSNLSPRQKVVSFSDEVDIIKPPMIESGGKKNILKKAIKIIKMKKKEVN